MAGPRRLACGLRLFARLCAAAAALLKQLQATKLQLHDADIYVEPTATEVNLTQVPVFQNMIMTEEQARDGVTVHMEGGGRDARLRSARRDRPWRLCGTTPTTQRTGLRCVDGTGGHADQAVARPWGAVRAA